MWTFNRKSLIAFKKKWNLENVSFHAKGNKTHANSNLCLNDIKIRWKKRLKKVKTNV